MPEKSAVDSDLGEGLGLWTYFITLELPWSTYEHLMLGRLVCG